MFGSEEQKEEYLPKILAGEIHFAIGYSSRARVPTSPSLRTRAVRDGDEYVINGQKIFTTGGHDADCDLARVPDRPRCPEAQGHLDHPRADRRRPGSSTRRSGCSAAVTRTPPTTRTCGCRRRTSSASENAGWKLITRQLNHERVALGPAGRIDRPLHDVLRWARETRRADGRRVIDDEWVQTSLARVHAVVEALKLANWRVAAALDEGNLNPADASAMKVLGTEQQWRCFRLLLEVVGSEGYLVDGSPGAVLHGQLEQSYRHAPVGTFGGGVNEVQREIIAMAGLDMPRAPR